MGDEVVYVITLHWFAACEDEEAFVICGERGENFFTLVGRKRVGLFKVSGGTAVPVSTAQLSLLAVDKLNELTEKRGVSGKRGRSSRVGKH